MAFRAFVTTATPRAFFRRFRWPAVIVVAACSEPTAPRVQVQAVAQTSGGISLDEHSCGIVAGGETYCWGAGTYGQLGNGGTTNTSTPVVVVGGQHFVALTAGGYHTCALTGAGDAYCWGRNNVGQLGNGGTSDAATPVRISGVPAFVAIDAGAFHTCALTSVGVAYCWGGNSLGQLGDGSTTQRLVPTIVSGGLVIDAISAGGNTEQSHTCARTASGAAYCWGSNGFGQLGTTGGNSSVPVQVSGGLTFESVAAGGYHSCGRVAGALYCWGYNSYGQLGNSTQGGNTPVQVAGGLSVKSVDVGGWTTCAVTQNGAGYCWGWGHYGERGDGIATDVQGTPTSVSGGFSFGSISPGAYHTCGITTAGKFYCWGYNAVGQLGIGTTGNKTTPTPVSTP